MAVAAGGFLAALVCAPLASLAQGKLRRIGWLTGGSPKSHAKVLQRSAKAGPFEEWAEAGALLSYAVSLTGATGAPPATSTRSCAARSPADPVIE